MTPEQQAISKLRDRGSWYCGDPRAAEVLGEYRAAVEAPLRAQLAAMTQARDDAVAAAHLVHESASPDLASTLLEQVQQQIDELKPGLGRDQCKDDYEHGHRNGAFFMLVDIRRALKERA